MRNLLFGLMVVLLEGKAMAQESAFPTLSKTNISSNIEREGVEVSPNPIISGNYFSIRFPERELIQRIELLDMVGEKINTTEILFSKMGMYMPKVEKGYYLLRIHLTNDTIMKKVNV